ncbi:MAG: FAD-dependent oxidoreductase [Devosia sp.]|uniref:NAD(P)/FAD-dependent oxidoreductase n=1 Tax=Devosia sp. TaxID=1871048 RepID=UPI003390B9B4
MTGKHKLVVVGAGMASGRALEHIFANAPGQYEVTLFGAEPRGNYSRLMLSPVLAGEKTFEETVTHDAAWYAHHEVRARFGEHVTSIDRHRKLVFSRGGETPYDTLIIATGSAPFILPVAGKDLPGVLAFRDLDDVEAMIEVASRPGTRAVVIGGGLLGLEAAAALRLRGMAVTVIHTASHLMNRQLDPVAGRMLQRAFEDRGIEVLCNAQTSAIVGHGKAEAVVLDDGQLCPADVVVMAVGIRPETRIATDAGIHVERGIVVDDQMRTSDPHIFALGECVEHNGVCYGLVAPLYDMAAVLADTLAGKEAKFQPVETATQLKVTGISIYSAGDFARRDGHEEIVLQDEEGGVYKRLILQDDRIVGAVLYGETTDGPWFFDLLKQRTPTADKRSMLVFGQAYQGGAPVDPMVAVAAWPANRRNCNGRLHHPTKRAA